MSAGFILRIKTCKNCKGKFQPERPLQATCSIKCAIELVNTRKASKERKELKEAKEKIKSRQDWIKEVQQVYNQYIRARDDKLPCISCQRHHNGQYHAGHYRTTKAAPELRFNELNVHKQCSVCNNHMSGNIVEYRINLIKKIGINNVEFLEGPHDPKKWTIEQLKELKALYKQKLKELK